MRRLTCFALLTLAALAPASASAQETCPTTPVAKQARSLVKHRVPKAGIHVTQLDFADVFGFDTPDGVSDQKVRASNKLIAQREAQAYELEGDLWRVKFEMNDCDLHLEMVAPGAAKDSDRVIVEIPADKFAEGARMKLLKRLTQMKKKHQVSSVGNFTVPVRVRVTGLAFWDGAHWTKEDPVVGNGHGTQFVKTLWELHPVWKLDFVPTH